MKDTILTARRKKTELITLLVCFIVANVANLYSIIAYKGSWMEMITSLFYIVIFTCALYVCWGVLRILFYGIKALFAKNRSKR